MDTIYKLSQKYIGYKGIVVDAIRVFKGKTEIGIDVSGVHLDYNPIIKLDIDFNDGTPLLSKSYNFDNSSSIVQPVFHAYLPDNAYHSVVYYPSLYLTFLNGSDLMYQCPVRILQKSYYNQYKNIDIASAQFIDNKENDLFCVMDTGNGDILNIKIK